MAASSRPGDASGRFCAILIERAGESVRAALVQRTIADLPPGEVLVRVRHSSLNYKDGLAILGRNRVVRSYPMVPGIDFAGEVVETSDPETRVGDLVIHTGWGLGEDRWGGFSGMARVERGWLVPVPQGYDTRQSMIVGTAGLTAMLCLEALEHEGVTPDRGEILVTGAGGGVGSMALALGSRLGYRMVAATGRPGLEPWLRRMGAQRVIPRDDVATPGGKAIDRERWAGAVDTVGGSMLSDLLRAMGRDSAVAACGLAAGSELSTTVLPFILRGVILVGISAVITPRPRRLALWQRIARLLPGDVLDGMGGEVVPLANVIPEAQRILDGGIRGRLVVTMDD